MKTILASASKRRQELLFRLVDNFEIEVSKFDEDSVRFEGDIDQYVKAIALGKALDVKSRNNGDAIIISADTVVIHDGNILGKPKDKREAFKMLQSLQGKSHFVYSGIVVINTKTNKTKQESLGTKVTFSEISDEEILEYIETGEPLDKAGSYGIQDRGGVFVKEIQGCYYNVVGLPLNKLKSMLDKVK